MKYYILICNTKVNVKHIDYLLVYECMIDADLLDIIYANCTVVSSNIKK